MKDIKNMDYVNGNAMTELKNVCVAVQKPESDNTGTHTLAYWREATADAERSLKYDSIEAGLPEWMWERLTPTRGRIHEYDFLNSHSEGSNSGLQLAPGRDDHVVGDVKKEDFGKMDSSDSENKAALIMLMDELYRNYNMRNDSGTHLEDKLTTRSM